MRNVTPFFDSLEVNRMKREGFGPRAETIALIRCFARIYNCAHYDRNIDLLSVKRMMLN
jgi:hypothetical protein